MFTLSSEITVGNFRFSGVHEVLIKRSLHSIVETATIKVPSIAVIAASGKVSPERISTARQITDGDEVTIKLGYNGVLKTEFRGFVKRCNLDMPLEIECEGYSWLLRKKNVSIAYTERTIQDLLKTAISNEIKIRLKCDVDLDLVNIAANNATLFDVVNYISKWTDGNVTCFFIESDTLWCGLLHSHISNGLKLTDSEPVSYRTGYNTLKKNTLSPHDVYGKPGAVEYIRKRSDGEMLVHKSKAKSDNQVLHSQILNNIKGVNGMKLLADERLRANTYKGYEGQIISFLQPYAAPGYTAYVEDSSRPELNGNYLIESTEVSFGINGARRKIELGPKVGF